MGRTKKDLAASKPTTTAAPITAATADAPPPPPVKKRARSSAKAISVAPTAAAAAAANKRIKTEQQPDRTTSSSVAGNTTTTNSNETAAEAALQKRFMEMFQQPEYAVGISNDALKRHFHGDYPRLAPIINKMAKESRLAMSRMPNDDLFYNLVSDEVASKFAGLDVAARMVYQVIERNGNNGVWTKDIKKETNIQNQALTKILKTLENRQLVKPVKSVNAKAKKLYMPYDLKPSTELTGGVWYSDDLEFDHEFISEMRTFLMYCVRQLNGGKGCTLVEIMEKMEQAKVSRVSLSLENVNQLIQTLAYDNLVEEVQSVEADIVGSLEAQREAAQTYNTFVPCRRVSTACDFKWWSDVLEPDFHFRKIIFEDGVTLAPHEPHYHTN